MFVSSMTCLLSVRTAARMRKSTNAGKKNRFMVNSVLTEALTMWDNLRWAVDFCGVNGRHMIGSTWTGNEACAHDDEPARALLFCSRSKARAWVAGQNAELKARNDWWGRKNHYRVVRVRETVRRVT